MMILDVLPSGQGIHIRIIRIIRGFFLFRYGIPFISYSWIVAIGLLKGIFVVLVGILHGIASVIPFVEATPYLDVHFSYNE